MTPTTVYWSTDLSIENSSMVQYDETSTMSWYNKGKISFTNMSQNINCLQLNRKYQQQTFFVRPFHSNLLHKRTGCKQDKTIFWNEIHGSHICNPDFNNEDCRFDGGDCCLPIIDDKYCPPSPSTACNCHEDNSRHTSFTEGMQLIYRTRAIIVLLVSQSSL